MQSSDILIKVLEADDSALLENVAAEVFDSPLDRSLTREFLTDPRHHIVVAVENDQVIGFASGVHYVHPDKPAELLVNEVGVASTHQRHGIAARLLGALFAQGKRLGCREAWVATEPDNPAARALYTSVGGREDPTPFVQYSFSLER